MRLRLLSYNIQQGGHGREAALAEVIRAADPDVVMLQEATDPRVTRRLADQTGLSSWDSRSNHSTGFLTRLPVAAHQWTQPRGARHAFLEVAFEAPVPRVFCLHLTAWFSNWNERRRRHEIGALLHAIKQHQDGFHIIAGDFNALAPGDVLQSARFPNWIRAMVWLSGRDIARHTIQHMLDQNYIDVWRVLNEEAEGFTFPTWDPHVRLDYMFTPARYREALVSCAVFQQHPLTRTASDHFPLLVELETEAHSSVH